MLPARGEGVVSGVAVSAKSRRSLVIFVSDVKKPGQSSCLLGRAFWLRGGSLLVSWVWG